MRQDEKRREETRPEEKRQAKKKIDQARPKQATTTNTKRGKVEMRKKQNSLLMRNYENIREDMRKIR